MQMLWQHNHRVNFKRVPLHYVPESISEQRDLLRITEDFPAVICDHSKKINATLDVRSTVLHVHILLYVGFRSSTQPTNVIDAPIVNMVIVAWCKSVVSR